MRAIASAIVAAQEAGRPLRILWTSQPFIFTAPFKDIFKKDTLPPWVTVEDVGPRGDMYWQVAKLVRNPEEWMALKDAPILKSYYAFYKDATPEWTEALRMFTFVDPIRERQRMFFSDVRKSGPIVGVHIRRTDNHVCIANSPSELFWKEMDGLPSTTQFFVASDSQQERDILFMRYGERVHFIVPELLGRNEYFGCMDAVLDFYCLSCCDVVFGSYKSSFSEVAAAYGGACLKIIKNSGFSEPQSR
jgi:hypothetical protein